MKTPLPPPNTNLKAVHVTLHPTTEQLIIMINYRHLLRVGSTILYLFVSSDRLVAEYFLHSQVLHKHLSMLDYHCKF